METVKADDAAKMGVCFSSLLLISNLMKLFCASASDLAPLFENICGVLELIDQQKLETENNR